MVSGRVVRIAGLVVGGAALVFALLPFGTTYRAIPDNALGVLSPSTVVSCGPPVVEATRTPPRDEGWFGYAPLTSTPPRAGFVTHACYTPARHRLIVSGVGLFVATLLGFASGRIDGDPGPLRRRRWRPEPA